MWVWLTGLLLTSRLATRRSPRIILLSALLGRSSGLISFSPSANLENPPALVPDQLTQESDLLTAYLVIVSGLVPGYFTNTPQRSALAVQQALRFVRFQPCSRQLESRFNFQRWLLSKLPPRLGARQKVIVLDRRPLNPLNLDPARGDQTPAHTVAIRKPKLLVNRHQ
jgi:hypothetical protein